MKPRLMVSRFGRPRHDWAASSGSCGPEYRGPDRNGDERRKKPAWPALVARLSPRRDLVLAVACLIGISTVAIAQTITAKDIQEDLEKQGYTNIHDIKFGAEAITAKATKDGKERSLVIDSKGNIIGESD